MKMLKKFLAGVLAYVALLTVACGRGDDITSLSKDEVYFFYQDTCPHCHEAADYIKKQHKNMRIKPLDIKMPGNRRLFEQAVRSYDIGQIAGTPLICFGKRYIMGWGDDDVARLDEYAKDYE